MKSIARLILGLLAAAGSGILVLAAASLSLVEGGMSISVAPALPTASPTFTLSVSLTPAPTIPGATATHTVTASPTIYQTPFCRYPDGWLPYTVQPDEKLETIAAAIGSTVETLEQGNCMHSAELIDGDTLYLPGLPPTVTPLPSDTPWPTDTIAPPRCIVSPRPGWTLYMVTAGDTLYRLSQETGTTVTDLMVVNCLPGTRIVTGQRIYLPRIPVRVPTQTRTPIPEPTETGNPSTPTPTESGTKIVIPTVNATETAAANATASAVAESATAAANATSAAETANAAATSVAATASANATAISISLTQTAAAAPPPEPPQAPGQSTPVPTPTPK